MKIQRNGRKLQKIKQIEKNGTRNLSHPRLQFQIMLKSKQRLIEIRKILYIESTELALPF